MRSFQVISSWIRHGGESTLWFSHANWRVHARWTWPGQDDLCEPTSIHNPLVVLTGFAFDRIQSLFIAVWTAWLLRVAWLLRHTGPASYAGLSPGLAGPRQLGIFSSPVTLLSQSVSPPSVLFGKESRRSCDLAASWPIIAWVIKCVVSLLKLSSGFVSVCVWVCVFVLVYLPVSLADWPRTYQSPWRAPLFINALLCLRDLWPGNWDDPHTDWGCDHWASPAGCAQSVPPYYLESAALCCGDKRTRWRSLRS